MTRKILGSVVFLVFLSGCQFPNSSISTPTLSPFHSGDQLTQTIPTTPTTDTTLAWENAATPTWTLLPTFPADEGSAAFLEIFGATEDCRFPCWGGIIPGETSWEQTMHYLNPYNQVTSTLAYINAACPTFGDCNVLSFGYLERGEALEAEIIVILPENTVKRIWFRVLKDPLPEGLAVADILNTYGPPSMVLMDTNPNNTFEPGYTEGATMLFLLPYPDHHFMVLYYREAYLLDNSYVNCISGNSVVLIIFDTSTELSSIEAITSISEQYHLYVHGWRPIEEVTNLTQTMFYDRFRSAYSPCITSSIENWQR